MTVYISTKFDKLAAPFKKRSKTIRDDLPDSVAFGSVDKAKELNNGNADTKVNDDDTVLDH